MSSMRGWPSSRKPGNQAGNHVTIEPTGVEQFGQTVNARVFVYQVASDTAETGSTTEVINATGHVAQIGDIVRFTSGTLTDRESKIISVETNSITVADVLPAAPSNGDVFLIMRPRYPQVDVDGNLIVSTTPGPVQFVLDSVDTEVKQDTVTPGNSRPLPVKVFRDNGTDDWADDVEVLLTSLEAALASIDNKIQLPGQATMANSAPVVIASDQSPVSVTGPLTDAQLRASAVPISAASLPLPTGASTLAEQQSQTTLLGSIDVVVSAAETSLALIDNAIQTQGSPAGNDFMQVGGFAGGNAHRWQVNASGHGQVELAAALPSGTNNIGDVDVATLPVAYNAGNAGADTQRVVIATDQAAVATKAPRNTTGSIVNDTLTGTTPQTETAPANAVGFILFADDDNDDSIRFAIGSAASTSVGCRLAPGRDSGFIPSAANVSLCAIAGTGTAAYALQWIVES